MKKQNELFRKAALDRLSSPEQLHTLTRITEGKGWLALVGLALILVTTIAWASVGSVQTKVNGSGILLGGGGLVQLDAAGEGDLVSIDVEAGGLVKRDQVIAQIAQPALTLEIESLKRRIEEIDSEERSSGSLDAFTKSRRDRLRIDLEKATTKHTQNKSIISPVDGRVVEVRCTMGEHVTAGTPIVAIEKAGAGTELDALFYFDAHRGRSLRPGMTIEIVPSVVRKERYGVLLGRVRSVDEYPSTRAQMMNTLRNAELVDAFLAEAGGAPIAVRAELLKDASTPSGLRWSSGAGPDMTLTSGTRCSGAVITRAKRPITVAFPMLDDGG